MIFLLKNTVSVLPGDFGGDISTGRLKNISKKRNNY